MTEHTEKKCPKCGQRLRFPKNIGGVLMACPSCGEKFNSDFKLGGARQSAARRGFFTTLFELPYKIVSRIGRHIFPK
jgi:predicted amidophosphoribosyltransferase